MSLTWKRICDDFVAFTNRVRGTVDLQKLRSLWKKAKEKSDHDKELLIFQKECSKTGGGVGPNAPQVYDPDKEQVDTVGAGVSICHLIPITITPWTIFQFEPYHLYEHYKFLLHYIGCMAVPGGLAGSNQGLVSASQSIVTGLKGHSDYTRATELCLLSNQNMSL